MIYIYENRTDADITVTLAAENNLTAAQHTFPPKGRMELTYPGLDGFVPPLFRTISITSVGFLGKVEEVVKKVVAEIESVFVAPVEAEVVAEVPVVEAKVEDAVKDVVADVAAEVVAEVPVVETKVEDVVKDVEEDVTIEETDPSTGQKTVRKTKKSK